MDEQEKIRALIKQLRQFEECSGKLADDLEDRLEKPGAAAWLAAIVAAASPKSKRKRNSAVPPATADDDTAAHVPSAEDFAGGICQRGVPHLEIRRCADQAKVII